MAREMKNSGIEWIGEIPDEWEVRKVKNYYDIQTGFTPDTKNELFYDDADGYDWVNISDIQDGETIYETRKKISKYYIDLFNPNLIPKGSLLYSFKLSVGQTAYAGKSVYSNEAIASFTPSESVNLHYLRYSSMFIVENAQINIYNARILNQDLIKNAYITFPPLWEQQRIATFLDKKCAEIDAVIDKTKTTIEEYKKLKQSVITEAVTKGIRQNRPMKDSGIEWIGEIPVEWGVRKLKTFVTQISKGATPKEMSTEKTNSCSIRFFKSENIVENKLVEAPEFYIGESIHFGELKRSQLTENDIMFVIAGASIGKVAIVLSELLPANTNQAMSFIRVSEDLQDVKEYLWYVLQSDIMKLFITLYSVQSAQPNISMEKLGGFRLCIPYDLRETKDILTYLNRKCSEIDELIAKKTSLLSELESYKKSLIYEYVTGKKEVLN